jgi:hypothetical protein
MEEELASAEEMKPFSTIKVESNTHDEEMPTSSISEDETDDEELRPMRYESTCEFYEG